MLNAIFLLKKASTSLVTGEQWDYRAKTY